MLERVKYTVPEIRLAIAQQRTERFRWAFDAILHSPVAQDGEQVALAETAQPAHLNKWGLTLGLGRQQEGFSLILSGELMIGVGEAQVLPEEPARIQEVMTLESGVYLSTQYRY